MSFEKEAQFLYPKEPVKAAIPISEDNFSEVAKVCPDKIRTYSPEIKLKIGSTSQPSLNGFFSNPHKINRESSTTSNSTSTSSRKPTGGENDNPFSSKEDDTECSEENKEQPEEEHPILTFQDYSKLNPIEIEKIAQVGNMKVEIRNLILEIADAIVNNALLEQLKKDSLVSNKIKVQKKGIFVKEKILLLNEGGGSSNLSAVLKTTTNTASAPERPKDFVLNVPAIDDPNRKELKVYLLGTSDYLKLVISKKNTVGELINHIMTVLNRSSELSLEFQQYPEAYELRLLEDDEDYRPFYEVAPLVRESQIGELNVDQLAFTRNKKFKADSNPEENNQNPRKPSRSAFCSSESILTQLRRSDNKTLLRVHVNIGETATAVTIEIDKEKKLRHLFEEVYLKCTKRGIYLPFNSAEQFRFIPYNEGKSSYIAGIHELLHYNSATTNYYDMKMPINNLSGNAVQLVEKVFADIPNNQSTLSLSNNPISKLSRMSIRGGMTTSQSMKELSPKKEAKTIDPNAPEFVFIYNHKTAFSEEIFDVTQIRFSGRKTERILEIDGYYLYHLKKKGINASRSKNADFSQMVKESNKEIVTKLVQIFRVEKAVYNKHRFYIWFIDKGKTQRLDYEAKEVATASKICAKIKFLQKHHEKTLGKQHPSTPQV